MQSLFHSPMCTQPTLGSDGTWGIWSQRLPNVIYAMKFPFTKIFCYTCEWALQGNMRKHQIVVIFTCTDISQEDIIHYCGTWYGSHRGRLGQILNTLELSKPLKRTRNGPLVLVLMLRWIINKVYVHIMKSWKSNLIVMTICDGNFLNFHLEHLK